MNYDLLKEFAIKNRKNPTEAESILWECLKKNALGKPFRRQYIIGDYIADFFCLPSKLVVEIDGGYHQLPNQIVDDALRTDWLVKQGYRVVRFTNEEVICDIENVLQAIKNSL